MNQTMGGKSYSDVVFTSSCLLTSSPSHNPNSTRVQNMIRNEYVCHEFWDLREIGTAPFRSDLVAYIRRQAE